jgi:hypothetical protein
MLTNNDTFWEELIAYFLFIRHGQQRKRRLQQFFVAQLRLYLLPSNNRGIYKPTHIHTRKIIPLLRIYTGAGTCLPKRCVAMERGTHVIHTLMEGIYEVYHLLRHSKVNGDRGSQTHRSHKPTFIFFQNNGRRLKQCGYRHTNKQTNKQK